METLTLQQADDVSGANYVVGFVVGKLLDYVWQEVMAGHVDYSGVADAQGTYYNTVGA